MVGALIRLLWRWTALVGCQHLDGMWRMYGGKCHLSAFGLNRAAARNRVHGSTAPVPRVPCPFRQGFSFVLHGTVTARLLLPTGREKRPSRPYHGLAFLGLRLYQHAIC
ncbi:hypothetical protein DFH06DRAFT_1139339 [Mycena polygramma]|nr:hypothetical protein DFH06DRAFT_1139339 [Mycena polygramma]